ncbi:hypothetical protein [Spirosoma fluviale]|uniref:Uncharacterized protein n=1 Tax=Spirosoma fluviale TaxID=1597977 RepID=A0A286FCF8_9BACT|nr:hypothetical protein [Spirosoma fluviale]SOD80882.1 hypothetical protein SAMN06269250_1598 [Spirosoma fluviale]
MRTSNEETRAEINFLIGNIKDLPFVEGILKTDGISHEEGRIDNIEYTVNDDENGITGRGTFATLFIMYGCIDESDIEEKAILVIRETFGFIGNEQDVEITEIHLEETGDDY